MAFQKGQTARLSKKGEQKTHLIMQREGHGIETRMGQRIHDALLAQLG